LLLNVEEKFANISFADTGHGAQLRLGYRFESEKLLNLANQADPFYIVKTDTSKIVAFLEAM
jgi:hypothetical protein